MRPCRGQAAGWAAGALLLAAGVVGCSDGFGPDDGVSAVLFGRVRTDAGAPVAGAEVDVTTFSGICGSRVFSTVSATTDSAGRYATSLLRFARRRRSCLEVVAVPPAGSGLRRDVVQVPNVSLSSGPDSLQVNLTLTSAADD